MKIEPIVKQEPSNEGMEGKTEASDEMGNKNYPISFTGSGDGRR